MACTEDANCTSDKCDTTLDQPVCKLGNHFNPALTPVLINKKLKHNQLDWPELDIIIYVRQCPSGLKKLDTWVLILLYKQ